MDRNTVVNIGIQQFTGNVFSRILSFTNIRTAKRETVHGGADGKGL